MFCELISRFRKLFFIGKFIFCFFIVPYVLENFLHDPKVILGRTRAKVTFFEAFFIDWLCSRSAGRVIWLAPWVPQSPCWTYVCERWVLRRGQGGGAHSSCPHLGGSGSTGDIEACQALAISLGGNVIIDRQLCHLQPQRNNLLREELRQSRELGIVHGTRRLWCL